MNQPTGAEQAKSQAELDYLRARTNAANLDVRKAAGQQAVGGQIADLFVPQEAPRPDPGFEGPMPQQPVGDVIRQGMPQVYGNAMAYGMKPDDVASTFAAMVPWASDDETTRANAYLGTGKPIGVNDAFSLEGRDAVAGRNDAADLAQALAVEYAKPVGVNAGQDVYLGAGAGERGTPSVLRGRDTKSTAEATAFNALPSESRALAVGPSETQVKGNVLQGASPEDQRVALLGQSAYGPSRSQREAEAFYALPSESQALAVGPTESQAIADVVLGLAPDDQRVAALGQPAYGPSETQARGDAFGNLPGSAQSFAVGPTETEFRGTTLANEFANLADMGPEQQNYFGLQEDRTPRNYSAPDGAVGVTLDGTTDSATGEPIPAGSQISTSQLQTDNPNNLRPNVVGKLQESQLALADFQTTTNRLRKVAGSDPSLFGATGNLKRFGQALAQQGSALSGAFDDARFAEVGADLERAGVAPQFFDPNLNIVDKLATMAAYQAAAVAGQTGQGLSNKDFDKFRGMIGDPTAWLSDQQSFITGLDAMEALVLDMAENRRRFLEGGPAATQGDPGVADAPTPPAAGGNPVYDIEGNRIR
jgi:hypothetical protein